MTTLEHSRMLATVGGRSMVVRAGNWISAAVRAWKNRREFYRLGEMSDAELADIGLYRTDLHVGVGQPFTIDPTARLGALVEARVIGGEDAARRVC